MKERLDNQEQFDMELTKFPDIEQYKRSLQELWDIDKSNMSQEEIKALFFEKVILHPYDYWAITKEAINALTTFRVRLNIDTNLENMDLIRTFSYPSPSYCLNNGRANLKNKPVFYCSDRPVAAIIESKPNIGDIAFMSVWKIECNRNVQLTSFLPPDLPDENIVKGIMERQQREMAEHSAKYAGNKSEHLIALKNFLAKAFVNELSPYPLSSWVSDKIIYAYDGYDYIMYPSILTEHRTVNFAFHPNFVDQFFRLSKVYQFLITDKNENSVTFNLEKVGELGMTAISWRLPNDDDQQFFSKHKLELVKSRLVAEEA